MSKSLRSCRQAWAEGTTIKEDALTSVSQAPHGSHKVQCQKNNGFATRVLQLQQSAWGDQQWRTKAYHQLGHKADPTKGSDRWWHGHMLLHNLVRCYQLVLGQLGVCQLGEWKITLLCKDPWRCPREQPQSFQQVVVKNQSIGVVLIRMSNTGLQRSSGAICDSAKNVGPNGP